MAPPATAPTPTRRRRPRPVHSTTTLLWATAGAAAAAAATLMLGTGCEAAVTPRGPTAAFIPVAPWSLPRASASGLSLMGSRRRAATAMAADDVESEGVASSSSSGTATTQIAGGGGDNKALWGGLALPFLVGQQAAMAASGAGRIAGRATDIPPTPPPSNERIERSFTPGGGSTRGSDHFSFEFGRSIPKIRIRDGDAMPDDGLQARSLRTTDVAVFGTFAGAALAQHELRKRFEGGGAGGETDLYVVAYQLALYDTHGVLAGLQRLARRADTTTSAGLASLASSVCLELLRSYEGWVASKATSAKFKDLAAAEREFNEMSIRERKKWAYENTLEDRAALKAAAARQQQQRGGGGKAIMAHQGKHLMVVTLMVACRRIGGKQVLPKRPGSSEALESSLERFAASLLEKNGRNVIAVDVSWTPDSADDILSRLELTTKWPDLIDF